MSKLSWLFTTIVTLGSFVTAAAQISAAPDRSEGDGPFQRMVLRGATVIDGTGAPPIGPVDIVVENDRIVEVKVVGHPGADIDPDNYQMNQLRFGAVDEDSSIVYNYEISRMQLDADLVLLNACETSKGEYFKGEGVYSFSQSLILSGAKSVLSSLWSINDETSSDLGMLFYHQILKGQTVGTALSNSKKEYLSNSHPDLAHPYYWSYLIYIYYLFVWVFHKHLYHFCSIFPS